MLLFDFIKTLSAFIFFAIARSGKSPALGQGFKPNLMMRFDDLYSIGYSSHSTSSISFFVTITCCCYQSSSARTTLDSSHSLFSLLGYLVAINLFFYINTKSPLFVNPNTWTLAFLLIINNVLISKLYCGTTTTQA